MSELLPDWARWSASAPATVGIEEEVMLLRLGDCSLAQVIEDVLPALPRPLAEHVSAETHAGTLELATGVHATVGEAIRELVDLRQGLHAALGRAALVPAGAGTHPFATAAEVRVSESARHQLLESSLRGLTRREPTFALHVHVGVPDRGVAVRVMNRLREHLPALLALSANSPFVAGADTGLASARTHLFQAFPRVGIPRPFSSYTDWVRAIHPLIAAGAVPESTFFWWDIRLQPRFGTVEIRIMDTQTNIEDVAALAALAQSLVVAEAEGALEVTAPLAPEVLDENRFLAARDGILAAFVDPGGPARVPATVVVEELAGSCRTVAAALGCEPELDLVARLAADPPAERQRALAAAGGLREMLAATAAAYSACADAEVVA